MKKLLLLFFTVMMIAAASGCALFTKEVDYQKIADELNKKNMDAILYAENGYAKYDQISFVEITYKVNGKTREETRKISINGVYNTNDNTAFGTGQKSYEMYDDPNSPKGKKVKDNIEPSFNLKYLNNQYINLKTKEPMDVQFIFDKLQGIERLKPDHYTYGLDEPPSLNYNLNEKEFNTIVNDDLKLKYDTFKGGNIFFSLHEDSNKIFIDYITVGVEWEGQFNSKPADFILINKIYPTLNNKNAYEEFKKYLYLNRKYMETNND
ncbi:UNVERIFIED_ORG: hypothetical protein ABRZ91_000860 [Heyndrickxia coagulans]